MNFADYRAIVFRRDGRVLHATFNRPDTLNAFNEELEDDVSRLFQDVAADEETAVLVLTGAGRAFSAGGDFEQMQRAIDNPDLFLKGITTGKRMIFSLLDCPKPVIAKLNDALVNSGICDVIV